MKLTSMDDVDYIILNWEDIDSLIDRLARYIETDYRPDLIVGIKRGGDTVANLLTDRLSIYNPHSVGAVSYDDISVRGDVRIYQPLTLETLEDCNVLLVDDVSDKGETLLRVLEKEIMPKKPKNIRTATLHVKSASKLQPHFFAQQVDQRTWIVYPWERYETVYNLYQQLSQRYTPKLTREKIVVQMGLPEEAYRRVLSKLTDAS